MAALLSRVGTESCRIALGGSSIKALKGRSSLSNPSVPGGAWLALEATIELRLELAEVLLQRSGDQLRVAGVDGDR
jgi:hypothetical protein